MVHCHFAPKRRGPVSLRVPVSFWRIRDDAGTGAAGGGSASSTRNAVGGSNSGAVLLRPSSGLSAATADGAVQRAVLSVHGAGTGGLVRFEPEVVDFGTLLVGSEVRRVLLLVNDSDCCMFYRMESRRV